MKNLIGGVLVLLVLIGGSAKASINDLFISEFVDGSGYNKAIELFNGNAHTIDLSEYQLAFYLNGSSTIDFSIELSGTLSAYTTFVVANSLASSEILIVSDQTRNGIWFDGDDVVALVRNGVIIDSVGQVGITPGKVWGKNQKANRIGTIRRLPSEDIGDVNLADEVDFKSHWKSHGEDNFGGLGSYIILGTSAQMDPPQSEELKRISYHHSSCTVQEQVLHYC